MSPDGEPARAAIIQVGDPRIRAARIRIDAPAERIFDLLARPSMHPVIDGSGTVKGRISGPERLGLGARFGMRMRIGLPYVIWNEVIEFEDPRRIAWRHVNHHVWRYELESEGSGTLVTETFDGTTSRQQASLRIMRAYERNEVAMARTLVRLKSLAEEGREASATIG